jgi:hypothetical protein
MNNITTKQPQNYIDISDLSKFLVNDWSKQFNLDSHKMQIIEEVVFLCANDEFIKDIQKIRAKLRKRHPKLDLPTSEYRKVENILGFLYEYSYKEYKNSIEGLIKKYKLIPTIYWRDKLFMLDSIINDEIKDARDDKEKITKKEAFSRVLERLSDHLDPELLDYIIILNKPFDIHEGFPFWVNPYITREQLTDITINLKRQGLPYLEIGFPPYANLKEMQTILKANYKKIQEYREANLPLPVKRDHRKDNLPKMIDAYMRTVLGDKETTVAIFLDKRYGGSISFEGVKQLVSRMKKEADRFNYKQVIKTTPKNPIDDIPF